MLSNKFAPLQRGPVGNNRENDPGDVTNLKTDMSRLGYYGRDIENGYFDRDLHNGIFAFQKDHDLRQDGYTLPGGETEAVMAGRLAGFAAPEKTGGGLQREAAAGAVPLAATGLMSALAAWGAGKSLQDAWDNWQNMGADEREDALSKAECHRIYDTDVKKCNRTKKRHGKAAAAVCFQSAADRQAACISGQPLEDLPPLQDKY